MIFCSCSRPVHMILLLLYHKIFLLSNSRSAEVPFLNIISYLIQFVKFRSIWRALDRWRVFQSCLRGNAIQFATNRSIWWRRGVGVPVGTRPGPRLRVSGFKVKSCIWLHSRENFAYVYPIGKSGRIARDRPGVNPSIIISHPARFVNRQIQQKLCDFFSKTAQKWVKYKKNRHFWRFLVTFSAFDDR